MMVSKKFNDLMGLTASVEPTKGERPASTSRTAPGQMIGALTQRDAALDRVEQVEAELAALKDSMQIPLDQLHEVAGRRRRLTEEEYAELKANLRQHGLITPITVRRREEGGYEVVSGHNRLRAFRELAQEDAKRFGRIKAYVDDADAAKTDELAFYANLLHPDLPEYEKFLGLVKIRGSGTDLLTYEALAERTGLSKSTVGQLMKFSDLPKGVQALLEQYPNAIGSKTAAKLAALTEQGRGEQVTIAIKSVVEQGISQEEALKLAAASPALPRPAKSMPVVIKSGRATFCRMHPTGKTLRLDFASEALRQNAEQMVQELLQNLANEEKK